MDQPVINKQEAYEKLIQISRNNNNTTGNFLDFPYHQNYYKLTGIDLSRQRNAITPQQVSFTRKLEEDDSVKMFSVAEKQQKSIRNFSLDSLIVKE